MSLFERYLLLRVALCIIAGVALGHLLPGPFATIASTEIARVNLPVAGRVWLMIIPIMLSVVDLVKASRGWCRGWRGDQKGSADVSVTIYHAHLRSVRNDGAESRFQER